MALSFDSHDKLCVAFECLSPSQVNSQYGFRAKHSFKSQLLSTVDSIARNLDNHKQTNVLILHFSKVFDTVPHQRLRLKLKHSGIQGKTWCWISSWLTHRAQRILVDDDVSHKIQKCFRVFPQGTVFPRVLCSPGYCVPQGTVFPRVLCSPGYCVPRVLCSPGYCVPQGTVFPRVLCSPGYCVPQGTVRAPLMFLLYIKDIGENVTSNIKLFADDCLLFRTIDTVDIFADTVALQNDLCKMSLWTRKWQMIFNPEEYYTHHMYKTQSPLKMKEGVTLKSVSHHSYIVSSYSAILNGNATSIIAPLKQIKVWG